MRRSAPARMGGWLSPTTKTDYDLDTAYFVGEHEWTGATHATGSSPNVSHCLNVTKPVGRSLPARTRPHPDPPSIQPASSRPDRHPPGARFLGRGRNRQEPRRTSGSGIVDSRADQHDRGRRANGQRGHAGGFGWERFEDEVDPTARRVVCAITSSLETPVALPKTAVSQSASTTFDDRQRPTTDNTTISTHTATSDARWGLKH